MLNKLFFEKKDISSEVIRQKLTQAVEARVDFNMDLFLHKRLIVQLKGACMEVRPGSLKLYLRGDKSYTPPVGMQVHAYFSLREKRRSVPYDFLCESRGVEQNGSDTHLILSMPAIMGGNQRRYNVRIPAGRQDDILDFKIWYGKPLFLPDAEKATKMQWMPFDFNHVEVFDISAGGIQVGVNPSSKLHTFLSLKELLLIQGSFEIKGKGEVQLAMVGPIVRLIKGQGKIVTCLGLRFKRWATVRDGKFHWMNLAGDDGIPPIAAWIFQTILARSRVERDAMEGDLLRISSLTAEKK